MHLPRPPDPARIGRPPPPRRAVRRRRAARRPPGPAAPYRLARRHGRQEAIDAIAEAAHITALWARHGFYRDRRIPLIRALRNEVPITGKLPSGDAVMSLVTYPETVDLARVLAMPRWRIPAPVAAGDLQRFQQEVRSYTGIRYEREDSRYDPLFRWFQKRRGRSA